MNRFSIRSLGASPILSRPRTCVAKTTIQALTVTRVLKEIKMIAHERVGTSDVPVAECVSNRLMQLNLPKILIG